MRLVVRYDDAKWPAHPPQRPLLRPWLEWRRRVRVKLLGYMQLGFRGRAVDEPRYLHAHGLVRGPLRLATALAAAVASPLPPPSPPPRRRPRRRRHRRRQPPSLPRLRRRRHASAAIAARTAIVAALAAAALAAAALAATNSAASVTSPQSPPSCHGALWSEPFAASSPSFTLNTAGNVLFSDGSGDFLGILNGAGASCFGSSGCTDDEPTGFYQPSWSGFTKPFMVGEDLDGEGSSLPVVITWTNIDVSWCSTTLTFAGASRTPEQFETQTASSSRRPRQREPETILNFAATGSGGPRRASAHPLADRLEC